ncbi:unnamed protein product, partial [Mesorhabditis spiculigera]
MTLSRTPSPRANIAAANSAVCTVFANPRSSFGNIPVERKPMQPMNATTNNGISGGRFVAVLSTIVRCRMLRNAMTGANINTRASFTTVATPNAVAPRALPAATTCATSWIDPPAHMPASISFIPKASASKGIVGIIRVPKITTSATAVSNSSSRAFTTPSAAATAAAPQIEKAAGNQNPLRPTQSQKLSGIHGPGDTEEHYRHHNGDHSPTQTDDVGEHQLQPEQSDTHPK